MTKEMIYMAYGSNMNRDAMKRRCPKATYLGAAYFPDHRLVFKSVADMIPAKGHKCAVALWRLTPDCEAALDRYEGFCGEDPLRGLYRKEYWTTDGKTYMAYVMNRKHFGPPSDGYYKTIEEGFGDADVPTILLKEARDHSFANEMPDPHVSKRWGNYWTEQAAKKAKKKGKVVFGDKFAPTKRKAPSQIKIPGWIANRRSCASGSIG